MKKKSLIPVFIILIGLYSSSCKKKGQDGPEACFTFADEIVAGTATLFSSACSENADSYLWSFGDGGTSTAQSPSHTYDVPGDYTVTLTIMDPGGNEDESSQQITVLSPAILEHSGDITEDETWAEGVHLITGNVNVSSATLTIEPGAVVRFNAGTELRIGYSSSSTGASLIAEGTMEKPILFTSAATSKTAGDWDVLGFYSGSSNLSSLEYCTIEYGGGYSDNYGMIYIDGCGVSIKNSTIAYSAYQGVFLTNDGFFTDFMNNTLMENGMSDVQVHANYTHTLGSGNDFQTDKGIAVVGDNIEVATPTWLRHNTPYIILGNINVGSNSGSVLTLDPGVEVELSNGVEIRFGYLTGTFGTLVAEGSETEKIHFRSAAPAGAGAPGDWDMLGFYSGAGTSSSMDWCVVEHGGGYSQNYGMIYLDGAGISLTNSEIRSSQYQGVVLNPDAMFTACTGNTFEGNGTAPIQIYANFAHTVQAGNAFNSGTGILVKGDDIEQAEVSWAANSIPWVIDGRINLGNTTGAKLIIEPGATVAFTVGSEFRVGYLTGTFGILEAKGTMDNGITFTSAAPSGFEAAGDWDGIWFYSGTSNGTVLDYCTIEYGGGYSTNSGNIVFVLDKPGLPEISNSTIRNSAAWGIYYQDKDATPVLTSNTYSNNASGDISPL